MMFYSHYDKRSWAEAHTQIVNCRKVYTTYIYTYVLEETATHSSILAWRFLWTEEFGEATVHGVTKSQT